MLNFNKISNNIDKLVGYYGLNDMAKSEMQLLHNAFKSIHEQCRNVNSDTNRELLAFTIWWSNVDNLTKHGSFRTIGLNIYAMMLAAEMSDYLTPAEHNLAVDIGNRTGINFNEFKHKINSLNKTKSKTTTERINTSAINKTTKVETARQPQTLSSNKRDSMSNRYAVYNPCGVGRSVMSGC